MHFMIALGLSHGREDATEPEDECMPLPLGPLDIADDVVCLDISSAVLRYSPRHFSNSF